MKKSNYLFAGFLTSIIQLAFIEYKKYYSALLFGLIALYFFVMSLFKKE